jgi:2,4-dienoyl-CoA reductase (NADPH2)
LGGQILSASKEVKGGENLLNLIAYYKKQIEKSHIRVKLGVEVDRKICVMEEPDVVVLATGAYIEKPGIPGMAENDKVFMSFNVLEEKVRLTNKRIVVIEGGKVGLVTAEYFASQGNIVWIILKERRVDFDVSPTFKWRHSAWVKEFGIRVLTESKIKEIVNEGILVISNNEGKLRRLEADMIIVAGPRKPDQELFEKVEFLTDEIYLVGDSVKPRSIHNAIHEGYKLGVKL